MTIAEKGQRVEADRHHDLARPEDHPAVLAWTAFRGCVDGAMVSHVLKESPKSCVYRLQVPHWANSRTVVAKKTSISSGALEQYVYVHILPAVPRARLLLYGTAAEPSGDATWLFLEDAGDQPMDPNDGRDRTMAGDLLADLHGVPIDQCALPESGPEFGRAHLASAAAAIAVSIRRGPHDDASDAILEAAAELLRRVDARWSSIIDALSSLPQSFVHGDLSPKNTRRREARAGSELVFIDWEMAGRGWPAVDVASLFSDMSDPGWEHYVLRTMQRSPALRRHDFVRAHEAGLVVRLVVSIDWAAASLSTSRLSKIASNYLGVYVPLLRTALSKLRA